MPGGANNPIFASVEFKRLIEAMLQYDPTARPSLVNIMTHGVNGTSVWSKAPTGVNTSSMSALQTTSGGAFTTLTIYGLNSSNTGLVSSGSTTLTITFGLVS